MADARDVSTTDDWQSDRCRVDVWLWRARLFRTRSLASRFVEVGLIRLTRQGQEARIDKPSRLLMPGDELVFARDGRLFSLRVQAVGDRRGSALEARTLYSSQEAPQAQVPPQSAFDDADQR